MGFFLLGMAKRADKVPAGVADMAEKWREELELMLTEGRIKGDTMIDAETGELLPKASDEIKGLETSFEASGRRGPMNKPGPWTIPDIEKCLENEDAETACRGKDRFGSSMLVIAIKANRHDLALAVWEPLVERGAVGGGES